MLSKTYQKLNKDNKVRLKFSGKSPLRKWLKPEREVEFRIIDENNKTLAVKGMISFYNKLSDTWIFKIFN